MPINIQPPDGWLLDRTPTAAQRGTLTRDAAAVFNRANIEARLTGLREWATVNGFQLQPTNYSLITYEEFLDVYGWTEFSVFPSATPNNDAIIGPFPCTGCGRDLRVGQIYCEACDRFVVCDECHLTGLRLYGVRGQEGSGVCTVCSAECASVGCHNRLSREDGFDRCPDCDPRGACTYCHRQIPLVQLVEHTYQGNAYHVCPECAHLVCAECDGCHKTTTDRRIGGNLLHICDACAQVHYDRERAAFERWDTTELPVSGSLLIPGTASRPIRTVSIETEFDGDGRAVGRALASAGLVPSSDRGRYRDRGENTGRYPCLLKSDASVTGGEIVSYLLDLDTENHAAALMRMTEVMRGCREMNQAEFTHRAGGHVHIDLHGLTARDLWAQYTLFKWLETPIFYLAGAGAAFGHRTLKGSGYSPVGPDGPFGTVGGFATKVLNRGDRWALHYSNFAYAKEQCVCGAMTIGEWENCSCNLGQATAEWRVWNSEINPRILHGWLAFMQAITAYTSNWTDFDESKFPPFTWIGKHFKYTQLGTRAKIKERLEWIHRELPLTLHERDSLIYAAKRSELIGLGEAYLDSLLDIQANNEFGIKKPARNPGSRKGTVFALAGGVRIDTDQDDDDDDDEW